MKCPNCDSSDVSQWTASAGVEWKECNSCGEIFDKWDDTVELDFIIVNKKPSEL